MSTMMLLMALCGWLGGSAYPAADRQVSATTAAQEGAETLVTLRIGESVTPADSTTVVTVTGVSDDSRCPTGANCIWAGDATVTLRLQPAQGEAQVVALHIGRQDARSVAAAGLRLRLERLDPAPKAGESIAPDQYRVVIAVSRSG